MRIEPAWLRYSRYALTWFSVGGTVLLFYLLIKQAFSLELESFAWPPIWFPSHFTLKHVSGIMMVGELRDALIRSVEVAMTAAALATLLGTTMAYVMRSSTWARVTGVAVLTMTRLLPMVAVALPLATTLIRLHLYDSKRGLSLALVHAAMALPIAALLLSDAFERVSVDLDEAAYLDGASKWDVFLRIHLPQLKGALASAFVLCFLTSWDEFGFALLLQPTHRTLPSLIYYYAVFGDVGPASALSLLSTGPVLIMLLVVRPLLFKRFHPA